MKVRPTETETETETETRDRDRDRDRDREQRQGQGQGQRQRETEEMGMVFSPRTLPTRRRVHGGTSFEGPHVIRMHSHPAIDS